MRRLGIIADSIPFDDICSRLPSLVSLSLQANFGIVGDISGVVTCIGLQHLTLASNGSYGVVLDLSPLTKLHTLNIAWNHFIGMFPWRVAHCHARPRRALDRQQPVLLANRILP